MKTTVILACLALPSCTLTTTILPDGTTTTEKKPDPDTVRVVADSANRALDAFTPAQDK